MDRFWIAFFGLLAVVLQTTLVMQLRIFGIAPDLVFLVVIFLALQRQNTLTVWAAFLIGLLQDIASGGILGLNALILLNLSYLILYLRQKFFQENLVSQIMLLLIFTFGHQFLTIFWMNTLLHTDFPVRHWLLQSIGMSLYHVLIGTWLYRGWRVLVRPLDAEGSPLPVRRQRSAHFTRMR